MFGILGSEMDTIFFPFRNAFRAFLRQIHHLHQKQKAGKFLSTLLIFKIASAYKRSCTIVGKSDFTYNSC